jgi:hypothetical protein
VTFYSSKQGDFFLRYLGGIFRLCLPELRSTAAETMRPPVNAENSSATQAKSLRITELDQRHQKSRSNAIKTALERLFVSA